MNMQAGLSNPTSQEEIAEAAPTVTEAVAATEEISGTKIESPMVGTFYIAPSPTSAPFINEVKSSVSGKVKKILVKDGDAIKKGQALVIIE